MTDDSKKVRDALYACIEHARQKFIDADTAEEAIEWLDVIGKARETLAKVSP